jgi:8-oxo-dGTP diphosphatase
MADNPILAAGGIVVRGNTRPTVAVVQLRKDGDWVLPKGKLNRGEDALAAAQREVHEETGHAVTVKEFIGTLCYEVNGRSKIVQFWRMHPNGGPVRELMDDIKQVAWLPLEKAIRRLARPHEKAFLASAGPAAIKSHRETTVIRVLPSAAAPAPAATAEAPVVEAPMVEATVVKEPATIAISSVNIAPSRRRNVVARAFSWLRRRKA